MIFAQKSTILIQKEFKHILRDKRTMLILFGMPLAMMLLFGFAIRTDVKNVRTIAVTSSWDNATSQTLQRIDASEYFTVIGSAGTAAQAERMIRSQKADMAIVFAPDFASGGHGNADIQVITDATDPNMAQQYASYLQQIVLSDGTSRPAPVMVRHLYNPSMQSSYNFVPGIMGMLLMLICAMMTSISIVREKERGTMEVLLVSPVRPITIILSKAVPYLVLSLVIVVVILLMSRFVLGVPLAGSLLWISLFSLVYIFLSLALGLIISNVANSQLVALLASAMILLLPCVMLSGLLFPTASMPKILQAISCIVPATHYISAMRKLMIMGVGIGQVLTELAILAGYATLLTIIALATFKQRMR